MIPTPQGDLSEYQVKLVIRALENEGFRTAEQASSFRNLQILDNAKDLFLIAAQYRKAIGWPERDDTKTTAGL